MKKIISIILATIVAFSVFTLGANAKNTTSGTCGENLTWTFDETTGVLTISGTGYMYDYGYHNEPPLEEFPWNNYNIKKVIVTEGVKSIAGNAFYCCETLLEVVLPDGIEKIGGRAFEECYNLESINLPDSITTIDIFAFSACRLRSVTLPKSLTSIADGLFSYCTLEDVHIPENVTNIGYESFEGTELTDIEIPASVTFISFTAFSGCDSLENITVDPNNTVYSSDENGVLFNKEKTELIIYPCGNERTEYTIPQGVTTISYSAFSDCRTYPNEEYNKKLSKLYIPQSVKIIEDFAFYYSTSITDIYYEGSETDWEAIEIGANCNQLDNATIHFNSNHTENNNDSEQENLFNWSDIFEIIIESVVVIVEICAKALEFIIDILLQAA